ncbi:MAG: glycine cleavage system protein GcvH [Proteobacteria bacterium]|nr:glycine cleavage system protein GcvH [Pseudomonadota bacterium]MBU1741529.1 glycine cleavage system protein GcvH [Pseudomonadota bacterium]
MWYLPGRHPAKFQGSAMKYHLDHAWAEPDGEEAQIGITVFAQDQLGKIVFVDLPEEDDELVAGEVFGQIESQKTVSDLIAPVSGVVIESNLALEDNPGLINESAEEAGWITRVRLTDPDELDELMDQEEYLNLVGE